MRLIPREGFAPDTTTTMRLIPRVYPQEPPFFCAPDTTMPDIEVCRWGSAPDTTTIEPSITQF